MFFKVNFHKVTELGFKKVTFIAVLNTIKYVLKVFIKVKFS